MFGQGPNTEQFNALHKLVLAQGEHLNAVTAHVNSIVPIVSKRNLQVHVLIGLLGSTVAEICGRSREPLDNLDSTLRRMKETASQFTVPVSGAEEAVNEVFSLIVEHAAQYLHERS